MVLGADGVMVPFRPRGVLSARPVVWLSDGARQLWRLFDECLSAYGTGILDFYHAVQNLWKAAVAYMERPPVDFGIFWLFHFLQWGIFLVDALLHRTLKHCGMVTALSVRPRRNPSPPA